MISSKQYEGFMDRLVVDQRGKNSLNLSEWEDHFLSSYSAAGHKCFWFTEGRRTSVDRMWRKYGPELNFPHPLDAIRAVVETADADPGGCEYLVRDQGAGGRSRRCNE